MATAWIYRHQHAGMMTSHVFTSKPTMAQLAPLVAQASKVHTKQGWGMCVEVQLLGPGEVPVFPKDDGAQTLNVASIAAVTVDATGTVENP